MGERGKLRLNLGRVPGGVLYLRTARIKARTDRSAEPSEGLSPGQGWDPRVPRAPPPPGPGTSLRAPDTEAGGLGSSRIQMF